MFTCFLCDIHVPAQAQQQWERTPADKMAAPSARFFALAYCGKQKMQKEKTTSRHYHTLTHLVSLSPSSIVCVLVKRALAGLRYGEHRSLGSVEVKRSE